MELALYCPVCGYYEKETDTIGKRGDFFTSVSVGNLFGELLAFQFAEWLEQLQTTGRTCEIVEAGAHNGQLAKDVLSWMRAHRANVFHQLEYRIVEPSEFRQRQQKVSLAEFAGRVTWVEHLSDLVGSSQAAGVSGVIFSNELLDAMPVHRLAWDAARKQWLEWGVSGDTDGFVWKQMQTAGMKGPELPVELLAVLPDGFATEVSPACREWWRQAAGVLRRGKLLAIDYGLTAEEFFVPERSEGTLRAYHRHQLAREPLMNPGEQDLTAHVNFSAVQAAGEAAGLKTEGFMTQEQFLNRIAARISGAGEKSGERISLHARQFQTLTHPEHLGSRFRVLIQSR